MPPTQPRPYERRNFLCSHCPRRFSRAEHAKRHERNHTKERPFCCVHCSRTFVRRDILTRHTKAFHPAAPESVPFADSGDCLHHPHDSLLVPASSMVSPDQAFAASADNRLGNISENANEPPSSMQGPTAEVTGLVVNLTPPQTDNLAYHSPGVDVNHFSADNDLDNLFQMEYGGELPDFEYPIAPGEALGNNPEKVPRYPFPDFWDALRTTPQDTGDGPHLSSESTRSRSGHSHHTSSLSPSTIDRVMRSTTGHSLGGVRSDRAGRSESSSLLSRLASRHPSFLEVADECPTNPTIARFIGAYFRYYATHFPFVDPHNFGIAQSPPILVLAIAAIGAQYLYEHETGLQLHLLARRFIEVDGPLSTRACSDELPVLWEIQAALLTQMFAFWRWDSKGMQYATSLKSFVCNATAKLQKHTQAVVESLRMDQSFRKEARYFEEVKRTFFAAFVFGGIMTATTGENPALFAKDCAQFKLPSTMNHWISPRGDEEGCEIVREAFLCRRTFGEVFSSINNGMEVSLTELDARILIVGLYLNVWTASHVIDQVEGMELLWKDQMRRSLRVWKLSVGELDRKTASAFSISKESPIEHDPLVLDALSLYRRAQVQMCANLDAVVEYFQGYEKNTNKAASSIDGLRSCVARSPSTTVAMRHCFDSFSIILGQGPKFGEKIMLFLVWGIEQAVHSATFSLCLFLWLSQFDSSSVLDPEETALLTDLRQFLEDSGTPISRSLPGLLSGLWVKIIGKTSPWQVTSRLSDKMMECHEEFSKSSRSTRES